VSSGTGSSATTSASATYVASYAERLARRAQLLVGAAERVSAWRAPAAGV
jgi:hypothetical protein